MNTKFNFIVNNTEMNALKEMILKRAAEKAEQKTEEEHTEIMDMARNSFISKNNPFSQIANQSTTETSSFSSTNDKVNKASSTKETNLNKTHEIGFPIKQQDKIIQTRVLNNIKNQTLISNMKDARESLNQNLQINTAVKFLNNQALISLLKEKSKTFEIII